MRAPSFHRFTRKADTLKFMADLDRDSGLRVIHAVRIFGCYLVETGYNHDRVSGPIPMADYRVRVDDTAAAVAFRRKEEECQDEVEANRREGDRRTAAADHRKAIAERKLDEDEDEYRCRLYEGAADTADADAYRDDQDDEDEDDRVLEIPISVPTALIELVGEANAVCYAAWTGVLHVVSRAYDDDEIAVADTAMLRRCVIYRPAGLSAYRACR